MQPHKTAMARQLPHNLVFQAFNVSSEYELKKFRLETDEKGKSKRSRWWRDNKFRFFPTELLFAERADIDLKTMMLSYLPKPELTQASNSGKIGQWKKVQMTSNDSGLVLMDAFAYLMQKFEFVTVEENEENGEEKIVEKYPVYWVCYKPIVEGDSKKDTLGNKDTDLFTGFFFGSGLSSRFSESTDCARKNKCFRCVF